VSPSRHLAACVLAALLALPAAAAAAEPDKQREEEHTFELSFGQSQLFDIPPLEVASRDAIPTTSAVFIYEHFLPWELHIVSLFNLPLSTTKVLTDTGVVERFAPPSLAFGLAWSGPGFAVKEFVRVEVQLGLLGGAVLSRTGRFFPLGSVRVAIRRTDGFGLYIGAAGAFRVDTVALVYGVGHRF
jgi:hypothetical protein